MKKRDWILPQGFIQGDLSNTFACICIASNTIASNHIIANEIMAAYLHGYYQENLLFLLFLVLLNFDAVSDSWMGYNDACLGDTLKLPLTLQLSILHCPLFSLVVSLRLDLLDGVNIFWL